MKNYLKYSLGLIVFVMIALIAMHWLPAITIDGHTMRRVDLLSDVRPSKSDMEELDTDSLPPVPGGKADFCRHLPHRYDLYRRLQRFYLTWYDTFLSCVG